MATDETDGPIRVFLLDDHEVVRAGLREMLQAGGEFEVVGEAGTAADALPRIRGCDPDVAVLDVRLPDGNGIEVCRDIKSERPHVGCLMLTSFTDDEALLDAMMAGAAGFVLKQVKGTELIDGIRRVASGQTLLDPDATRAMVDEARARLDSDEVLGSLTPQERRIFELIGRGLSNRQIGEELYLAEKTVKNYVSNLLAKLGLSRRTEVAAQAARLDEHRRSSYRYDSGDATR